MVKPLNSFTKPKYLGMLNSPSITKTSIIKDMKKKSLKDMTKEEWERMEKLRTEGQDKDTKKLASK